MVKVLAMELYDVPDTVPYLQVADSLVVRDMVVWVVPAVRMPVGLADNLAGGAVSVRVCPEFTLIISEVTSIASKSEPCT